MRFDAEERGRFGSRPCSLIKFLLNRPPSLGSGFLYWNRMLPDTLGQCFLAMRPVAKMKKSKVHALCTAARTAIRTQSSIYHPNSVIYLSSRCPQ